MNMTMNPIPPQAYTKDTMLKAYAWLMNQNPSLKEMATTPDILVSLYLKATRDGDSALERPSIQNFKNELKSLAGLMGELDKTEQAGSTSVAIPTSNKSTSVPPKVDQGDLLGVLDAKSLEMIREVKEDFNLSSNHEALRMLIKLGHTRSKNLLK